MTVRPRLRPFVPDVVVGVAALVALVVTTLRFPWRQPGYWPLKSAGKNRVAVFTPDMLMIRVERMTLEREVRTASEHGGSSCTTSR